METYLYTSDGGATAVLLSAALKGCTERHKVELSVPQERPCADVIGTLAGRSDVLGLIIGPGRGWVGRPQLKLARRVLRLGKRAFFHWPHEKAIEVADSERVWSHWRIWLALRLWLTLLKGWRQGLRGLTPSASQGGVPQEAAPSLEPISHNAVLDAVIERSSAPPAQSGAFQELPTAGRPLRGAGVYLRTDFWARIESGGSYGHSCYVAKELAAVTERFVCFMPHRYSLLDDMGLQQCVMTPASVYGTEKALVEATPHYVGQLRLALQLLRPSYVYERLCLGNYAGAQLAQELGVPYIVEYNGSELSMIRSFGGRAYVHEDFFLRAEDAAFRVAALISVISKHVKADLVARGVDPAKILVNPNGADPTAYAPPSAEERRAARAELGWGEDVRVIGFTGTFGGWHGVEVLAAALPRVCQAVPEARFLLIGDGNFKHLVDAAITEHGLADRALSVGRVPQAEGARLLRACDIYVSPHSRNMVDSPFFGSPTKLFEYMAMGGAIVASDLEQIGEVLQPSLSPAQLSQAEPRDAVAVLCTPGDVDEFVDSVVSLARDPGKCESLGRNARSRLLRVFTWQRHVERVFRALAGEKVSVVSEGAPAKDSDRAEGPSAPEAVSTGDAYKDEVQRQWDNDPAGSHYAKTTPRRSLAWFQEVEAYRYAEYAPWMAETMEFARHAGEDLLEVGGGMGTDLAQFAKHGARVTDVDLSAGHLGLARENFRLRGLEGRFVHHDAEDLPFPDASYDVVYSNGVIHHTPNTQRVIDEIFRVLRPGGRAIIMVYAETSLHYWRQLVLRLGLWQGLLADHSMGEIMSRTVEISENNARPLVKVYTRSRLRRMFRRFEDVRIVQRQLIAAELPRWLAFLPPGPTGTLAGWNLVVKANKPR